MASREFHDVHIYFQIADQINQFTKGSHPNIKTNNGTVDDAENFAISLAKIYHWYTEWDPIVWTGFTKEIFKNIIGHELNADVPADAVFTDTKYKFDEGTENGTFLVTEDDGTPQTVHIHGLGEMAFKDVGDFMTKDDIGKPGGAASLNDQGIIPSEQLPGFVDDVIDGYYVGTASPTKFYEDEEHTTEIKGEKGKLYVDVKTNIIYRWTSDVVGFTEIPKSLALGEGHDNAYYGDFGKVAYDHTFREDNPHKVTKEQIGLGNVENKSVQEIIDSMDGEDILEKVEDALGYKPGPEYGDFVGATDKKDGEHGLVPMPTTGQENMFLKGDGTWSADPVTVRDTLTLYCTA